MTVQPRQITNYSRSDYELQEFILFSVAVAGKSSDMQARKLDIFLAPHTEMPFDRILRLELQGNLVDVMKQSKIGQYTRIRKAWLGLSLSGLDLRTCTVKELEAIPGIGPKTARFFLLHSRPNQNFAVLDTHILGWMRSKGYNAPKATPSQPKYGVLEVTFLKECEVAGMSPADMDLQIWKDRQKQVAVVTEVTKVA
jgi:hypothetical protein